MKRDWKSANASPRLTTTQWVGPYRRRTVRPDKDAQANPGRRTGFHIDNFIIQNHATSGIKRKVRHSFQYHSGLGLAPQMIATILANAVQRVIRAVTDSGDCRAFRFKASAHPSRQVRVAIFVKITTAD